MGKLTKKQRNIIYKKALRVFYKKCTHRGYPLCYCINDAIKKYPTDMKHDYPELWMFKREIAVVFWFDGVDDNVTKDIRELALLFAIEITK